MDIFDNTILCKNCNRKMVHAKIERNGFPLRILKCEPCKNIILHPQDKVEYEEYMKLKQKEFNVKMRMVGNSYAVSIPREIVDFMQEQEKVMNNMVKLCFQEMGKISLEFENPHNEKRRIIKSEEIKVIRNNKPVFHVRKISDSNNKENNKTKIYKAGDLEESQD